MFKTLSTSIILALCFTCIATQPQARLVDGIITNITAHPYHVSVQFLYREHSCNGALIDHDIVVTTAACLPQDPYIYARLGNDQSNGGGEWIRIQSYQKHENFHPLTMAYDIAILKLSSPVRYRDKVQPIELAKERPAQGVSGKLTSWGLVICSDTECEGIDPSLRWLEVDIEAPNACAELQIEMSDSMLCGRAPKGQFCLDDGGAPLVVNGKLVGLASWNPDCSENNVAGIYTDVAALREWILTTAAKL